MRYRTVAFFLLLLALGCRQSAADRARAEAAAKRQAEHIAKLKSYVPAKIVNTIDPEFYSYPGFRDWYRIPLVYPYSVLCIDSLDAGCLCRHDGKSKISEADEEQLQGSHGLTAFCFNAHFLVGIRDEALPLAKGVATWVLIDFANGKVESFHSKEELAVAAKARGYSGRMEFADVRTHYEECFGQ